MNSHESQMLKKQLSMLAAYYQQQLPDAVIAMYALDLQEFDFSEVSIAIDKLRREPKRRTMPLPADVIAVFKPAIDDDSIARDAASRICQAIRKYGYNNPTDAKAFIGELGWLVVERNGGWVSVCEGLMDSQKGIFQAQARDLAKTQLQLARAGQLDTPPSLPEAQSKSQLKRLEALAQPITVEVGITYQDACEQLEHPRKLAGFDKPDISTGPMSVDRDKAFEQNRETIKQITKPFRDKEIK